MGMGAGRGIGRCKDVDDDELPMGPPGYSGDQLSQRDGDDGVNIGFAPKWS